MATWTHVGPTLLASFLASFVEFIEALTIVLAVGTVRGWKPALGGVVAGVASLAAAILILGAFLKHVDVSLLQLFVGALLLLFGMRWLRKAILRGAGLIALHDEVAAFEAETAKIRQAGRERFSFRDSVAFLTTFKAVVLEGAEVVFIVIAVGSAGDMLLPASAGAAIAGVVVIALGLVLHRPLARVPENSLKFTVGAVISAFGVFWIGEGLGFHWPGQDLSIVVLVGIFLVTGLLAIRFARLQRHLSVRGA